MNKMSALARSFPTLHAAQGVVPWQPEDLDRWASGPVPGSGALHAARFVLAVWNSRIEWECGRFDAVNALSAWDDAHRAAFRSWVAHPWWA
jgi:hypothetical protein